MSENEILNLLNDPTGLEKLYRNNPEKFKDDLSDAIHKSPDSQILEVWNVRLSYSEPKPEKRNQPSLLSVILISFICLAAIKLPEYSYISESWFYPRFAPMIVISSLVVYFFNYKMNPMKSNLAIASGILFCLTTMLFLPDNDKSASIIMTL